MTVLVSGGAASGKSEFAESLIKDFDGEKIYLATMKVYDGEGELRVERHRKLREGKGFITREQPVSIENADIPEGNAVLLECLSNLTANECFGGCGLDMAEERITSGIVSIARRAALLVIVSNEIFSDSIIYDEFTTRYMKILGGINRRTAELADAVVEVAATVPVYWKGEKLCDSLRRA